MTKKLFTICLLLNIIFLPLYPKNKIGIKKESNSSKPKLSIKSHNIRKGERPTKNVMRKNYDRVERDVAGRIVKIISKDRGETKYIYNELGELTSKINSDAEYERYYYDMLGRRIRNVYILNNEKDEVKFRYSTQGKSYKLGNLIEKIEKYEHCFYKYKGKELSEETKVINGSKFRIKYFYNKNGKLSELHYPSGLVVAYEYDSENNIKNIFIKREKDKFKVISYGKDKNSAIIRFGNGLVTKIIPDKNKREITTITGKIQHLTAKYNSKGLLTKISDRLNIKNRKEYYYDKNDRLLTTYGPYGKISYRYDDMDNLKAKIDREIRMELSYDKKSSRIKQLNIKNESIDIQYDKLGRMIKYNNMNYKYNVRGRLSKIYKKNELVSELFYNANNQRIIEKNDKNEYYYIYDHQDRILAKYKKDTMNKGGLKPCLPIIIKEYIYKENIPIGFISGGQIYYYHYDIMNFPIKITNNVGEVVQSVQYKPYGEIVKSNGIINDNLRFPGQFKIEGTKIFYNLNRTYNPELTRYLEPDPIIDYENIYQYALSNPVKFFDLKGKKVNKYYSDKTANLVSATHFFILRSLKFESQFISECTDDHPKYALPVRIQTDLGNHYFAAKFITGGLTIRTKPRQFSLSDFIKRVRDLPGGLEFKITFESVYDLFDYPQAKEFEANEKYFEIYLNFDRSQFSCQVGNVESAEMNFIYKSDWNFPIRSELAFIGRVIYVNGPYVCCWEKIWINIYFIIT